MPAERLSRADKESLASLFQLTVPLIDAVVAVESAGRGFLADGRAKILLEGHILWKRLEARGISPSGLARQHPEVCYPHWTRRFYRGGAGEYDRLAKVIDYGRSTMTAASYEKAGYEACSWGLMQLMGMNYAAAGFENVVALKQAMEEGELEQLAAALRWARSNGLLSALRRHNWRDFARGYNGSGNISGYSARLEAAYRRAVIAE